MSLLAPAAEQRQCGRRVNRAFELVVRFALKELSLAGGTNAQEARLELESCRNSRQV